MKKLIPFLSFSALALSLTLVNPQPSHAILCILDGSCHDGGNEAPEIDPSALGSAIALAIGGAAMLSDKLRRR